MDKNARKPIIIATVIAFAVVLGIISYNTTSQDGVGQVKVTALLPLTGPAAVFGQDEKMGIELALATQKAARMPLSFIFEDSQGKPDLAVSAVRKNYDLSGSRIYMVSTTPPTLAVLPILKELPDPTVTFVIATLSGITKGYPSAFRIYPSVDEEIRVLSSYAEKAGFKKIAAYCFKNQAGEDAIRTMTERMASFGGEVVFSDTFSIVEKDFRQVLVKIKGLQPDAILITGFASNYADVFRQMIENDMKIPVLAGVGMPLGGFNKQLPADFLSRVVFPATRFNFESENPTIKSFVDLIQQTGKVANYEIAYAYDTTQLLRAAVDKAGSSDPKLIAEAIKELMPYEGITGTISLDGNRDARLDLKACRYGNNGIELANPTKP
jgi:branched-chain amino acid transport system substrate-binding protein